MAAGIMRTQIRAAVQTQHGSYPLPIDYAAAMDEVFPPVTIEVADGVADQSLIALGAGGLTTIQGLALVSTVAISVKLGAAGSNVAIALAANAPVVLMGIALAAVSVSNSSGETALVTWMCAGT